MEVVFFLEIVIDWERVSLDCGEDWLLIADSFENDIHGVLCVNALILFEEDFDLIEDLVLRSRVLEPEVLLAHLIVHEVETQVLLFVERVLRAASYELLNLLHVYFRNESTLDTQTGIRDFLSAIVRHLSHPRASLISESLDLCKTLLSDLFRVFAV